MENKFSVLMSVYYKEKPMYLEEALNSVFNQTLKPNEVILVEDGKLTKELDDVIKDYQNKYKEIFKVIKYKKNRGLGTALHDGLLKCTNNIVLRMDTDDISDKKRFEKQLQIFANCDVDVVGTNIEEYDETMQKVTGYRTVPKKDYEIKKLSKSRNPINHMTVGFKKEQVINCGNYQHMPYFEDYYLWIRMIINECKFYNIQENLVKVRGGNSMIKRRGGIKYIQSIIKFETKLLNLKYINIFQYIKNLLSRITASLMPNKFRYFLYKKLLRK